MMNRKEFYEYVKDNVKEYLPESYKDAEIKLQEVEKNNGLKLTGITIPNGDQRIVPTVYLDSLYQEYIHGKDVDSCVGDVADMRIEAQGKAEFLDMGVPDILDYEKMKNKLQVRICDKEWNTDRLADKIVRNKDPRTPSLNGRIWFHAMRFMHAHVAPMEPDYSYWKERDWDKKNRPWK